MSLPIVTEDPVLSGRKVTVMGLGLFGGGVGVARYLAKAGAKVVVTDLKSEEDLRESVAELRSLPVELRLGRHEERDFRDADLVVVNPAVPPDSPYLRGVRAVETEMNLFLKRCRAEMVVGVTGSNGKSTTTTLIGEVLKHHLRRVWVGGNLGGSLLESLDEIRPDDIVVLELSSFQLDLLAPLRRSPNVAVVTNLTPNHLDRHKTMENYTAAKRRLIEHQVEGQVKVLNADDAVVRGWKTAAPSRTYFFSLKEKSSRGALARDDKVTLYTTGARYIIDVARRKLPGEFNLANMAAAAAASFAAGGGRWEDWRESCETVFNEFAGVEHRLEFVAERAGVKYYNDSKSTAPEATIAALGTLPGPFVLILGGYDKKASWDALARAVAEKPVRAVALIGQTAPAIEEALRAGPRVPEIVRASGLEEAVGVPARPGETVLLSPACASWDMFRNYTERGRAFKALVSGSPAE